MLKCSRNGCDNSVDTEKVHAGFFDQQRRGTNAASKFRGPLCPPCSKDVAEFIQRPKEGRGPGWGN